MCDEEQRMQEQAEAGYHKDEQDRIRKAVELAECFWGSSDVIYSPVTNLRIRWNQIDLDTATRRVFLDALVAQLKRQVDETEFRVTETDNMSWIEWRKDTEDPRFTSMHNGRTMNSLIVCVDFLTALAERAGQGESGG